MAIPNQRPSIIDHLRILVGVILITVGILLICISYFSNHEAFSSGLLSSIGVETSVAGGILLFLEYFLFKHNDGVANELKYYRELLISNGTLSNKDFTTVIPDLCLISENFHTYHFTRRDETEVWMYNPIKLSKDDIKFKINGERKTINKHNQTNLFAIQAGIRGKNLIIFSKKESYGSDETVIDIIHDFTNANNQYYCGIRFHETWDKNYSISPVLLTVRPFLECQTRKPFVLNVEQSTKVENQWKILAKKHKIQPLLSRMDI